MNNKQMEEFLRKVSEERERWHAKALHEDKHPNGNRIFKGFVYGVNFCEFTFRNILKRDNQELESPRFTNTDFSISKGKLSDLFMSIALPYRESLRANSKNSCPSQVKPRAKIFIPLDSLKAILSSIKRACTRSLK